MDTAAIGQRIRAIRTQRGITLTELERRTGVSASTWSRLEGGGRRATIELLLPLAREFEVTLDELVGAPETGDPRVHIKPIIRWGVTYIPLTRRSGGIQAYKVIYPTARGERALRTHDGYEWIYVLSGRLILRLGERAIEVGPGEAAEFDTRTPHAISPAGGGAEVISLFGGNGERAHMTTA
nr:XRE family transcriptional regulator [Microbacterium indicum]